MRTRTRGGCQDGHQPGPARSRQIRHDEHAARRQEIYDQDIAATLHALTGAAPVPAAHRLHLVEDCRVDQETGEILDPTDGAR
jgi:hypothetical protein